MRKSTAAAVAALASLALASAAQADSISFIRGGDVWVAAPDGARQVQLTHDGGYGYQSRADDGSFIALHGRRLRRLAPDGRVVAEFSTPVSGEQTAPNTSFFRGPFKPEISPDGKKVAYEYWYSEYLSDPGCYPVGTPTCTDHRTSVGIAYSHSDRMTDWDEPGLGRQSGWVDPSWIGNDTLLMSDKSVLPNVDTIIDHPGDGNQTIDRWFEDTGVWHVRDGEVSRRGDAAAFVTTLPRDASDPKQGQEDDQITVYKLNGAPTALPEQCFSFQNADAVYHGATFSPDGAHLAWGTQNRALDASEVTHEIVVGDIPSQAGGCRPPAQGGRTIIKDAVTPDWSPAEIPVITAPGPKPGPNPGPKPPVVGRITVILPKGAKLATALQRGLAITVRAGGKGTASATALAGRTKVASGTARVARAGTVKLTIRFTKPAARTLRTRGSVRLSITVAFKPAAGGTIRRSTSLLLRR